MPIIGKLLKKTTEISYKRNFNKGKEYTNQLKTLEKIVDKAFVAEPIEPKRRTISEDELSKIVDILPEYQGGPKEFQNYLSI